MITPTDIIDFWFGTPDDKTFGQPRRLWFQSTPAFDEQIRDRFLERVELAAADQLDHWRSSAHSCLALILLLDQFPRNLYRNTARAYATDAQALAIANWAIDHHYDQQLTSIQQWFIYLPFEHSEDIQNQEKSVSLFQAVADIDDRPETMRSVLKHEQIIRRFGRFPHRNAILGRTSTPEELAFLQEPGSSF